MSRGLPILDRVGLVIQTIRRRFTRQPGHVAATILMLAIGIGASTAVVSFLSQVLLQSTGIASPERLVEIYQTTPPATAAMGVTILGGLSVRSMEEQRELNPTMASVALASPQQLNVRFGHQDARRIQMAFVSAGYFETLGVSLRVGRTFTRQEETASEPLAVISHRLWTREFDRDRSVLGRSLLLNGKPCTIVGVAPEGFAGHVLAQRMDLWVPWGAQKTLDLEPQAEGMALGRLKPGVTLAAAASTTAAVGDRYLAGLSREEQATTGQHRARPFEMDRNALLADLLPKPWLMLLAPLLMLVLACANVANLQLAELELRRQEFASRSAVGASRRDIVRQVLWENLALGVTACLAGLALAYPLMELLQRVPTQRVQESRLDVALQTEAVLFASALTLLVVLTMGLVPALRASRANVTEALKSGPAHVVARGRLKDGLVALQVALALMLVATGMLVTRSLDRARSQDLGMRPAGVIGMRLQLTEAASNPAVTTAKLNRLIERARALPGVRSAAVSVGFPLENVAAAIVRADQGRSLIGVMIGADHFATLGVRVLSGREFTAEDLAPGARVVMINDAAARSWWPGEDPVGRMIGKRRVVGVVADHAAMSDQGMHKPFAFLPLPVDLGTWPCLLVRTDGRPEALAASLRQLAREVDPTAPVLRLATLAEHLDGLHHHLRVASWLLGLCGLVALALAAMGIQSLLAFRVARQQREIGLHLALGAARAAVVRLVVTRGLVSVLVGLVVGSGGAYLLSRTVQSLSTAATALHGGTVLWSGGVLLAVAVLASLGPAWRAVRVEPARALRNE